MATNPQWTQRAGDVAMDWEGDLPTEHMNRCKLRDDLLYSATFNDDGTHRAAWRCHKRAGHEGPCSSHNDCGVMNAGTVCGMRPGHSGPHEWATLIAGTNPVDLPQLPKLLKIRYDKGMQALCAESGQPLQVRNYGPYKDHAVNLAPSVRWEIREDEDGWQVLVAFYPFLVEENEALAAAPRTGDPQNEWQPIESCPKMRTILLFAVTDVGEDGTVKNWKMATGSWNTGYEDERSKERGITPWEWGGHQLKVYELHPTHWLPLPAPPSSSHAAPPKETHDK